MATKKQVGVAYGKEKQKVRILEKMLESVELERDLFRREYLKLQKEINKSK